MRLHNIQNIFPASPHPHVSFINCIRLFFPFYYYFIQIYVYILHMDMPFFAQLQPLHIFQSKCKADRPANRSTLQIHIHPKYNNTSKCITWRKYVKFLWSITFCISYIYLSYPKNPIPNPSPTLYYPETRRKWGKCFSYIRNLYHKIKYCCWCDMVR